MKYNWIPNRGEGNEAFKNFRSFYRDKNKIDRAAHDCSRSAKQITLIAVSKQQKEDRIDASLATGHRVFGENRVQEAQKRWSNRRYDYPDLRLHLIGPLQSNKAADAVRLFDVIHTVDRPKIATAIAKEAANQNKYIQCFIQVNTGDETQKSGISLVIYLVLLISAKKRSACPSQG